VLASRIWITWHAPAGYEPGVLEAHAHDHRARFQTYPDAVTWAQQRSDRIRVSIEGIGQWEHLPPEEDSAAIEAHIARGRERFELEHQTYAAPVEWFFAVLDLDTERPDEVAATAPAAPGIAAARIHRRSHRGSEELWIVLTIHAHSFEAASALGHDALFPLIWPNARIAAKLGTTNASWVVHLGRHEELGLAPYEADVLG
jgi:hypothetical protein